MRVARGESRTQLIMARGTRSEFLAKEGMPGPDGRLFETKLGFGRFLHETPKSMLVTVTPSMVHKEMPAMTLQQWLAIFRLQLRADIMRSILDSPANTHEGAATVGGVDRDGVERIFLSCAPGQDQPITKNDAIWMIKHRSSSSAAAAVACAPSLEGNLCVGQSVSQDKWSLRSTPPTQCRGHEVRLKVLRSAADPQPIREAQCLWRRGCGQCLLRRGGAQCLGSGQ